MNDTPSLATRQKKLFLRAFVPAAVMLALSAGVIFYGHRVYDYFAARAYTPTSEIAQIHDKLKLTGQGSDILYASQPQLESSEGFNRSCQSSERTAAILGCYYMRRVYLFNVTNAELAGAKEVTAAHEMLHAAYERLNVFDRANVDRLVDQEYSKLQDNLLIKQLMEYYKKTEPSALTNELHSILGTVVADLSPELERYYARYFNDRQHIVQVNNQYYAVFNEVDAKAKALNEKITALDKKIAAEKTQHEIELAKLKTDVASFKARTETNYYRSNSAMQSDARALNARVDSLEAQRLAINTEIDQLNSYIHEQNQLSVRVNELNSSINGITSSGVSL